MINRVKFCDNGIYEEEESLIKRNKEEKEVDKNVPSITGNDIEDKLLFKSKFDLSSLALPNGYIRRRLGGIDLTEDHTYLCGGDRFCFLLNENFEVILGQSGSIESSKDPIVFVEGEIGNTFDICYLKGNYKYTYSTVCFKRTYEKLKEYLDYLFYCKFTIKEIDEFYEEFDYPKYTTTSTYYTNNYMDCYVRNDVNVLKYPHRFLRYDRERKSYVFSSDKNLIKGDLIVYRIGNACILEMYENDYMMLLFGREFESEVLDIMVLRAWKMLG